MNKIQSLISVAIVLLALAACSENPNEIVTPEPDKGTPTAIGFPNGIPTSKVIGTSGGTVYSYDAMMGIEIPAGALNADTEITIQPIMNYAPNGNGSAYQLGPEDITFNKPVKIIFKHYHELSATSPAFTGIAFQGDDNIWYSNGKFKWDEPKGTVSTETNHFSRWSSFEDLVIVRKDDQQLLLGSKGRYYKLNVKRTAEFQLLLLDPVRAQPQNQPSSQTDDDVVPLIVNRTDLAVIIDYWAINGDKTGSADTYGTISVGGGLEMPCTYTAPTKKPVKSKNPVILSVHLRNLTYKDRRTGTIFKDLTVNAPIEIFGESNFKVDLVYTNKEISGGLGNFTLDDLVQFKVKVSETGVVTISAEQNYDGTITPVSDYRLGCTTKYIPFISDTILGMNMTRVEGQFFSLSTQQGLSRDYISLSVIGDAQMPKWETTCAAGSIKQGGEKFTGLPLITGNFLAIDSVQFYNDPTKVWLMRLTPLE